MASKSAIINFGSVPPLSLYFVLASLYKIRSKYSLLLWVTIITFLLKNLAFYDFQTTFKEELIEELKFALKFSGNVKPVKRKLKPVDGSDEAFAEAEGKDEILSLPSIRSGRSTSTHKTCHSHSSRHSNRSLAVAFAKRRSYSWIGKKILELSRRNLPLCCRILAMLLWCACIDHDWALT